MVVYTKLTAVVMPVTSRSAAQPEDISIAIAAVSAQVSDRPTFTIADADSGGSDASTCATGRSAASGSAPSRPTSWWWPHLSTKLRIAAC